MTGVDRALGSALSNTGRPTVIIAKTIKGKGCSEIETKDGWHGKALPPDMAERAIKELGGIRNLKVKTARAERGTPAMLRRDGSGAGSFFQAEAGIRDLTVAGVQTCALPI